MLSTWKFCIEMEPSCPVDETRASIRRVIDAGMLDLDLPPYEICPYQNAQGECGWMKIRRGRSLDCRDHRMYCDLEYRQEVEAGEQVAVETSTPEQPEATPPVMSCRNCGKIYKLKRYYELHVVSCKPVEEVIPPKRPREEPDVADSSK
jgi:hypothetical protein